MIGIFDSGSGGLSVLKEIRKRLPKADVIYLGDIKNAPYGSRSPHELMNLTIRSLNRLRNEGANKIVSACNSVSSSIVLSMLDISGWSSLDMIEMVGPTVKSFREKEGGILVVATVATVKSGIYQNGFLGIGKKVDVLAIPDLAGAIEFGQTEEIEGIIKEALRKVSKEYQYLVLACTHYPLVFEKFEKVIKKLGLKVELVDPACAVANAVGKWKMMGRGKTTFLITKESKIFRGWVDKLIGEENVTIKVLQD